MISGRMGNLTERIVTLAATVENMLKKTAELSVKPDVLEANAILTSPEPVVDETRDQIRRHKFIKL